MNSFTKGFVWGSAVTSALAMSGIITSGMVTAPKRTTHADAERRMVEEGALAPGYYGSLPKERFSVRSPVGELRGVLIPAAEQHTPARVVILMHGFSFNRMGEAKYIRFFRKRGFNAVLFDNRGSGVSAGTFTTMGVREQYDLRLVTDWVFSRFGADAVVGTHGESMGGATVLLNAAIDDRLAFVVADCPFASATDELRHCLRSVCHLPQFPFYWLSTLCARLRAGFYYGESQPIEAVKSIKRPLPIMFAHGTGDDFVPAEHTKRLFAAYSGPKAVVYGEGSAHTRTSVDYPEVYDRAIGEFLTENGII